MPTSPEETARPDDELARLPAPRRPWRLTTLVTLGLGALLSLSLAAAVLPDVLYALRGGDPLELGELSKQRFAAELEQRWVHGEGQLSDVAVRYKRPLEADSYRLARLDGNPRLWVQVRVPENAEGPRYVPPASFVGRLIPVAELGLRQRGLREAIAEVGLEPPGDDAWLLVDGESPSGLRWAIGLFCLLLVFAAFNVTGLVHLGRPITAGSGPAS